MVTKGRVSLNVNNGFWDSSLPGPAAFCCRVF
jgi:hypothetical protein